MNLSSGNSDNGYGGFLTDDAVAQLTTPCPNLKNVFFDAATQLTDTALFALVTNCKDIDHIGITGHNKGTGKVTYIGLKTLQEDKTLGPKLKHLNLTDQNNNTELTNACRELSK